MQKKVAKIHMIFLITVIIKKFQRESAIIRYLHQSIDHDYEGFDVYFQPIVDVNKRSNTFRNITTF